MELIKVMLERVHEASHLIDCEFRDQAEWVLLDMETTLDEMPAFVEDWVHMEVEVSTLVAQAMAWMHEDAAQAKAALDQLIVLMSTADAEVEKTELPAKAGEEDSAEVGSDTLAG